MKNKKHKSCKFIDTHHQAIQTKSLVSTNLRGKRVKAIAEAGNLTISWDHALNERQNHDSVVGQLVEKQGWYNLDGVWVSAIKSDNKGFVYIFVDRSRLKDIA